MIKPTVITHYLIIIYIELYINLHGLINFYSMNEYFSSVDSSQEEQNPLPVKFLYPPNQILTKSYPPDIKPVFKLMTKREQKEKPKINNQHHLIEKFEDCDTLGYDYSYQLKNNLVYFKLNNQNYFQLTSKGKTYKYLTGLFVSEQDLLNPLLKSTRSLYNILKNTEYTPYKNIPFQSISPTNSYDCAQDTVKFSSNFASGNLFAVIKNSPKSYTLFLQNDINSRSNTQWFNFVAQLPNSCSYTFKIVNFTKSSSLYEKGMHIAYFSQLDNQNYKIGWQKGCKNITYQSTDTLRQQSSNQYYYSLKFEYQSKYQNDIVQFAYTFPYNGLDLQKFFSKIHYKKISFTFKFEKYKICQTLSGQPVYGYCLMPKKHRKSLNDRTLKSFGSMSLLNRNISIGNLNDTSNKQKKLKSLIFMGRQHPGQTQSSFVIEGIIQFLLQNNDYQSIKGSYFIYIVPIVNIDGVLYGNYRSNLSGNDLNRIWRNPRKDLHCEIYHIKKWFVDINRETPIQLIIDIHGHSKSLNSFFYGMPMKKQNLYSGSSAQNSKFYPYLCSKKCKQISFIQSTFTVTEDKKNTARVVLSEMFPKALIYTFQNSFYGWKKASSEIIQYSIENYKKIGRQLVSSFFDYVRLLEKNNEIVQKWQRQIDEVFGSDTPEKQVDSDSENQNDLISPFTEEKLSQFQLKYKKQKILSGKRLGRIFDKPRQSFIPIPQSSTFYKNPSSNNRRATSKQSGFLSIVKIDPKPDQSLCLSQQRTDYEKSLKIFNERQLMEKLRKRKVNLDEVIKNCTGVKGFLRAMGITIQRR